MSETTPFECVLDARASLGEGPVWSLVERVLYWVDINAPSLNRFDPVSGHNTTLPMPESIGCFALRRAGGFVAALRSGVWHLDADAHPQRKIAAAPYDQATHRFNDGRCDPQGRFWPGTMNERHDGASAVLMRLDGDDRLTPMVEGVTISNGLAWSPDGRTMYHADTPSQTIRAYDFDPAEGSITNGRVFFRFTADADRPDGAAVDSDGCYWVALYNAGAVVRFAPDGRLLARYELAAKCPTMCAFGGADLRMLYVTTARQRLSDDELARLPHSGGIFAMRVATPGLPEPFYVG
ncbi:MAG: SMP-30/gluconolactonase/LRE family protein [Pseudomonadota bacterium]|nr:SMP-30/gluconolactonase/LRE family protein [Pseudomonadota bacterium]